MYKRQELELSVIEMADGSSAVAVVLREEAHRAGTGLTDISDAGGWRAYCTGPGESAQGS